jgi:hypothetical protein
VRQSRLFLRRNDLRQASTTADAASKAKDVASNTTSKAGEGLSRVTSSASSMVSGAAESASNAASKVQGRTGRYISLIRGEQAGALEDEEGIMVANMMTDTVVPTTLYYSRVGLELGRLVFKGQGMAPYEASERICNDHVLTLSSPSMSHVQSYTQPLTNAVKNPDRLRHFITDASSNLPKNAQSPEGILSSVRNVNRQQLANIGVIAAEVLGFFTVGTMIGRLKIVGYHGEVHHDH